MADWSHLTRAIYAKRRIYAVVVSLWMCSAHLDQSGTQRGGHSAPRSKTPDLQRIVSIMLGVRDGCGKVFFIIGLHALEYLMLNIFLCNRKCKDWNTLIPVMGSVLGGSTTALMGSVTRLLVMGEGHEP